MLPCVSLKSSCCLTLQTRLTSYCWIIAIYFGSTLYLDTYSVWLCFTKMAAAYKAYDISEQTKSILFYMKTKIHIRPKTSFGNVRKRCLVLGIVFSCSHILLWREAFLATPCSYWLCLATQLNKGQFSIRTSTWLMTVLWVDAKTVNSDQL